MLLYCNVTDTTGIALAEDMGIPSQDAYRERLREQYPFIIRWGVGCGLGYIPRVVVNKMNAVNNAVDKFNALQMFEQAGVRIAGFTSEAPCIGRSREHHQGSNMWFCFEDSQIATARQEGATHFTRYIPTKNEYRVHVCGDEVAFVQRKYGEDRVSASFKANGHNTRWFREIYTGRDVTNDIKDNGFKAVKALGLDVGAADVMLGFDGLAYVCEVNTGPSLPHPRVRAPYVAYFRKRMEELV